MTWIFFELASKCLCFLTQIWTMLPGFCTKPTDVVSSFKGIARSLGMAITERPDLRMCIYQALRALINKSCDTGQQLCGCSSFTNFYICTYTPDPIIPR